MLCPVCKTVELVMAERQGIEIDYCPTCRGVWLDRGELDKIIERSNQPERAPGSLGHYATHRPEDVRHHGGEHHRDHDQHARHGHPRSFWKELFD